MADFTGMIVKVTLKPPSSMVLQGKVKEVIRGELLTLQDVYFPHNGGYSAEYSIRGPMIADLQVVDTKAASAASTPYPSSAVETTAPPLPMPIYPTTMPPLQLHHAPVPVTANPNRQTSGPSQRLPSDFVDPAILSYGRSPAPIKTTTAKLPELPTPVKPQPLQRKAAQNIPAPKPLPFVSEAGKSSPSHQEDARPNTEAVPTVGEVVAVQQVRQPGLPQPQTQTQMGGGDASLDAAALAATATASATKKKARRNQKKKASTPTTQDPLPVIDVEVSRNGNDMDGVSSVKRGKGWRQTPLLQPSPSAASPRNHRERGGSTAARKVREAQQNGWATEDATDIQDMGDFDFEASHRLFDKQQVFSELRQGDTTADEDRLVSHNKLPRPGTYGGKNLHPTENVLSPQLGPHDSSSDADTELNFPNGNANNGGRSNSRHSITRVAMKKAPSRQNSAQVEGGGTRPHPLSASMSSDRGGLARSATSLSGKAGKTVPSLATSPMPARVMSPLSAVSATKTQAPPLPQSTILEPHLALMPTLTPCPVLLPSALETLETETVSRHGLSPEAITETAARSIAETATSMFQTNSRRGSRANTLREGTTPGSDLRQLHQPTAEPVVVIIAGNHATGARAIAAARHLITRRTTLIIAEAQYESPETQDPQMKAQLSILKRLVKGGASIKRGPWRRASNYIKNLAGPPAIIIDALLAGATYDSLLDISNAQHAEQAQTETREMIEWANRSRAPVLSVACPSGVSGADGAAPVLDGEPLAVRPDKVLCLGAPMQGLLDATKSGERWEIALADIGINITLRREEAVAFGVGWVVDLGLVGGG